MTWQAIEQARGQIGTFFRDERTALAALSVVEEALEAAERFENAVRIFDVMLNEPAAEGLMSAEDYQTYFRGAWLGVEEAAEHVRAALARAREGIKP